jgi:hypothetical protein
MGSRPKSRKIDLKQITEAPAYRRTRIEDDAERQKMILEFETAWTAGTPL